MRAFWRNCLAPLVMAAALSSGGGSAYSATAAATNVAAAMHGVQSCPAGTHWDNITNTCT